MLNLRNVLLLSAVSLVSAALFIGCAGENGSEPEAEQSDAWKEGLDEKVVKGLSQLSDEDRAAALEQKVCPVSDEPLGSMGKPPKVTVEGTDVFLCCAGCEGDLKDEPAKYLEKLNNE